MRVRTWPLLLFLLLLPATAAASLTQRDWMVDLVEVMGWSFGLPDEPVDADYRQILSGARRFRFEAEALHRPDDPAAVKEFRTFGDFSGEGWLSGLATPTRARLQLLLPRGGRFQVTAMVRLPGHRIRIGDQTFQADGTHRFTPVDLGVMELPAGELTVELLLPPNGGIDYLEFVAPQRPPVAPLGGWQAERPLTLEVMAQTAAQILGLDSLLPASSAERTLEAETAAPKAGVTLSADRYLGEPSGGQWLRAGAAPAEVRLSFNLPAPAVYEVRLRAAAGGGPLTLTINDEPQTVAVFPPYLESRSLGTFRLRGGENVLTVGLPPRGGFDAVYLRDKVADGAAYRQLTGLAGDSLFPTAEQAEALLALLAAIGESR